MEKPKVDKKAKKKKEKKAAPKLKKGEKEP